MHFNAEIVGRQKSLLSMLWMISVKCRLAKFYAKAPIWVRDFSQYCFLKRLYLLFQVTLYPIQRGTLETFICSEMWKKAKKCLILIIPPVFLISKKCVSRFLPLYITFLFKIMFWNKFFQNIYIKYLKLI